MDNEMTMDKEITTLWLKDNADSLRIIAPDYGVGVWFTVD
jgi:hypothetical protein